MNIHADVVCISNSFIHTQTLMSVLQIALCVTRFVRTLLVAMHAIVKLDIGLMVKFVKVCSIQPDL